MIFQAATLNEEILLSLKRIRMAAISVAPWVKIGCLFDNRLLPNNKDLPLVFSFETGLQAHRGNIQNTLEIE